MRRLLKTVGAVIYLVITGHAYADVNISKQYVFPIKHLETIAENLRKAADREEMDVPAFFHVGEKGVFLMCPPHKPKSDHLGCRLLFKFEMIDGGYLSINKPLVLGSILERAKNQTSHFDPNSTEEFLHFGNLFGENESSGSHYFCEPTGGNGARTWGCSLFVAEDISVSKN